MKEHEMYIELGKRLRAKREGLNLTQSVVAKRVGLSRPSIVNIEQGRQGISVWVLTQLAEVFQIEPAELLSPYQPQSYLGKVKRGK